MPKRLFDTSILIDHINAFPNKDAMTEAALRTWGGNLIEMHSTNWICSPVVIEVLAGTRNKRELALHRAYLSAFAIIDEGKIPPMDWQKAQHWAQRVPDNRHVRARSLGDCLIRAIAERLHCDVLASDRWYRSNR